MQGRDLAVYLRLGHGAEDAILFVDEDHRFVSHHAAEYATDLARQSVTEITRRA